MLNQQIADMKEWWEKTIQQPTPTRTTTRHTHSRTLSTALSEQGYDFKMEDIDPIIPLFKDIKITGFISLEVLNLEDNEIDVETAFKILGQLESLISLNLNKNKIKSLKFILDSIIDDDTPKTTTTTDSNSRNATGNPEEVSKRFPGFPRLQELRLANNKISDLEGILGILYLSSLNSVFIEGNPIMDNRRRIQTQKEFDLIGELESYGIQVSDAIYAIKKVTSLDDHIYKISNHKMKLSSKRPPIDFTGHMLVKGNASSILKHLFENGTDIVGVATIKEQKNSFKRREFKYTEEDIARMIKIGIFILFRSDIYIK